MTAGDVINDFRLEARDLVAPSRYRDPLCLLWYNDAVRDVYARRPELYEDIVMPDDTITQASSTSDTSILSEIAKRALVLYMLHKAAMYDLDPKKGAAYYAMFANEVRGG